MAQKVQNQTFMGMKWSSPFTGKKNPITRNKLAVDPTKFHLIKWNRKIICNTNKWSFLTRRNINSVTYTVTQFWYKGRFMCRVYTTKSKWSSHVKMYLLPLSLSDASASFEMTSISACSCSCIISNNPMIIDKWWGKQCEIASNVVSSNLKHFLCLSDFKQINVICTQHFLHLLLKGRTKNTWKLTYCGMRRLKIFKRNTSFIRVSVWRISISSEAFFTPPFCEGGSSFSNWSVMAPFPLLEFG